MSAHRWTATAYCVDCGVAARAARTVLAAVAAGPCPGSRAALLDLLRGAR